MKFNLTLVFCLVYLMGYSQIEYPVHKDSKIKDDVPKGKILGPFTHKSDVFPETVREYFVYAPNQYNKEKPAALMVSFDGYNMAVNKWKLPIVLDNLIHAKEVPVTIGVFIEVGVQETEIEGTYDRPIRSVEYDSRSPETTTMVIDEILPKVKAQFNISDDPNDHLIAGNSSGGNAAFSVAWERPDVFRRVFSGVGSYTSLRDGHEFLTLIRRTEHKPLRVYLQDGSNDLDNFSGNWFLANNYMLSSLQWAGYEVNHTWGEDTHGYRHAGAIMPDILRWLWKDYPKPIGKIDINNHENKILKEGETWQLVTNEIKGDVSITSNKSGEFLFLDTSKKTLNKLYSDGTIEELISFNESLKGLALSYNNEICSCNPSKKEVVSIYPKKKVIAKGFECDNLLLTKKGVYFLNKNNDTFGFYQFENDSISKFNSIKHPAGLSLSAEQSFLNITDGTSVHAYSLGLKPDGTPKAPLPFFHYSIPYGERDSGAHGMVVDIENQTYTATAMGLQIADQLGRTRMISPLPDRSTPNSLCFGDGDNNILYVVSNTGVFSRVMYQNGVHPWDNPIRPTKPLHVKPLKQ